MNKFRVVVTISHRTISFEYHQDGCNGKLKPFKGFDLPAPLAFYCSKSGIQIGEDAVKAHQSGNKLAFVDYFNLPKDMRINYFGEDVPITKILLYAAEEQFKEFFKETLWARLGGLEENRGSMPFILALENDIADNERIFLTALFKDSGYGNLHILQYDKFIGQYFLDNYSYENILIAWSDGKDLFMSYVNRNNINDIPILAMEGYGEDPRISKIADLIWKDVEPNVYLLERETEEHRLREAAIAFLSSKRSNLTDVIRLSDGFTYNYNLNRITIDNLPLIHSANIRNIRDEFLKKCGCKDKDSVMLVLRGNLIGNDYFQRELSKDINHVIEVDNDVRQSIKRLLVDVPLIPPTDVNIPQFTPELVPGGEKEGGIKVIPIKKDSLQDKTPHKEVETKEKIDQYPAKEKYATPPLKKVILQRNENDDLLSPFDTDLTNSTSTSTPDVQINEKRIKELNRAWRSVRADARGKNSSGNKELAISIINRFLNEVMSEPGTDAIIADIKSESENILKTGKPKEQTTGAPPKQPHKDGDIHPNGKWIWISTASGGKGDWRTIGGRIHKLAEKDKKQEEAQDSGKQLIAEGKLKEAREYYRAQNDTAKAKLLSEIIKNKKSVDTRKYSLDECRKTKNRNQIKRIISEIEAYIELCQKASVPYNDYKKLLIEYKKIQ